MKNRIVTGFFVCMTISQVALGIYLVTLVAEAPGMTFRIYLSSGSVYLLKRSTTIPSDPPHGISILRHY